MNALCVSSLSIRQVFMFFFNPALMLSGNGFYPYKPIETAKPTP
jgi:hypothetical protein